MTYTEMNHSALKDVLEQSGTPASEYPVDNLISLPTGDKLYIYFNNHNGINLTDEWLVEFTKIGTDCWSAKWVHYTHYPDDTTIATQYVDDIWYYVGTGAPIQLDCNLRTFFNKTNAMVIQPTFEIVERFNAILDHPFFKRYDGVTSTLTDEYEQWLMGL